MWGKRSNFAVTTLIARRAQVHQDHLAHNTFQYNPRLQQLLTEMTSRASVRTGSAQALKQSYGRLYLLLQQQASVLSYIDVFWILGSVTLIAIALLFLPNRGMQPWGIEKQPLIR